MVTIFSYTRKQAIEDGVLIDLSSVAPKACTENYRVHVACSSAVWSIIDKAVKNEKYMNSLDGVVYDILWMSRAYYQSIDPSTRLFKVVIQGAGRKKNFVFKAVVGPGDEGEPVLTIMMPEED